eukprot:CAMPEP_0196807082 /NCGR_PEP_ID=MMETSP1362-20130617/7018_1 /TAXON_ID=163516 /ORGANISM="Leptocylindrus danicus, Strain CCMP1856" /LENGTH=258 /DNA_ID=CAMNT_0042180839 /DNA_START=804 /DNA_END=1577 /DNA_ORIENTATION=+
MFNNCSRDVAIKKIEQLYPHLLPFVKTLYDNSTIVWVRKGDGTLTQILQLEGFAQGCPLAPILSAIVLQELLAPLQKELDRRALLRKQDPTHQDDDNNGSASNVMAYLDDTTAAVTLEDAEFIIQYIEAKGPELGCFLRPDKCKILTSTNGFSPLYFLPEDKQKILQRLNDKLTTKAEQTDGVRLLGTPDPHAKIVFFKQCIESKSAHLQLASLLAHDEITNVSNKTTFAEKADMIAQDCIANILQLNDNDHLPDHAW